MIKNCCGDTGDIAGNLRTIQEKVRQAAESCGRDVKSITIMAVTKTVAPERVNEALALGISLLGENRVQECCEKYQSYRCGPQQIHYIGHLQTNKIRAIINKVSMIESIDTIHLAEALHEECVRQDMQMAVLLQVNIGMEPTKSGFRAEELFQAYDIIRKQFPRLQIRGLMTIPPDSPDDQYFAQMQKLYQKLQQDNPDQLIDTLSMGMSGDFERAIRFGSTQIRLGRALFGQRPQLNKN